MEDQSMLGPRPCFDFAQHERCFGRAPLEHLILSEVEGRGGAHQSNNKGAA